MRPFLEHGTSVGWRARRARSWGRARCHFVLLRFQPLEERLALSGTPYLHPAGPVYEIGNNPAPVDLSVTAPGVAVSGNGTSILSWTSYQASLDYVYVSRQKRASRRPTPAATVGDFESNSEVAADAAGDYVVVYDEVHCR